MIVFSEGILVIFMFKYVFVFFIIQELEWEFNMKQLNIFYVAPGFKDKTRYTPYVSLGSQISHIAINKGNINR
jgi:hypothetical protein